MSAGFVLMRSASHAKASAPGTATNWIVAIVPMLNTRGIASVSAAYAPAIAVTVEIPSLKSR